MKEEEPKLEKLESKVEEIKKGEGIRFSIKQSILTSTLGGRSIPEELGLKRQNEVRLCDFIQNDSHFEKYRKRGRSCLRKERRMKESEENRRGTLINALKESLIPEIRLVKKGLIRVRKGKKYEHNNEKPNLNSVLKRNCGYLNWNENKPMVKKIKKQVDEKGVLGNNVNTVNNKKICDNINIAKDNVPIPENQNNQSNIQIKISNNYNMNLNISITPK
jgi:hypothetical protein